MFIPDDYIVRLGRDRNYGRCWLSVESAETATAEAESLLVELEEPEYLFVRTRLMALRSMGLVIAQRAEYSAENPDPF
jgi:hypothetical protein